MAVPALGINGHRGVPEPTKNVAPPDLRRIIDIRRDRDDLSLKEEIRNGLRPGPGGEKQLPTLLLYDEAGLKIFEEITYLEEYYLTNAEIQILELNADEIARQIAPNSMVVELGSGNLRKVNILLKAIDRQKKDVEYFALDLSLKELERTLAEIPKNSYTYVRCFGLHGTYDDGLEWLKQPTRRAKPKTILSIGSSLGNFSRTDAASFLEGFTHALGPADSLLIALDGCKDPSKVYQAYNDSKGITHNFIANGLKHANETLGHTVFELDAWRVIGEYNREYGRHQAFVAPREDTVIEGVLIKKGERVKIEESYKYDDEDCDALWLAAGVVEKARWSNPSLPYTMHMIAKRNFAFRTEPEEYAPSPVPTWNEWQQLWSIWDTVTRHMIPDDGLLDKPIKLRNACIFYLGHIPTFVDMKLAEVTNGTHTEPAVYTKIFERGIDPDVDNPEQCHDHSEIPDTWPPVDEILVFQNRVRRRVEDLYDSGAVEDPKVARGVWLGYEHEAMHLETLLYMLIQSEKTLPPPSLARPDFSVLADLAAKQAVPNQWHEIPGAEIDIGINDAETPTGPTRYFGWDIEKPPRKSRVPGFEAKARPISNGDYAEYLLQSEKEDLPSSWTVRPLGAMNGQANGQAESHAHDANGINSFEGNGGTHGANGNSKSNGTSLTSFLGDKCVRTVYGLVDLKYCLDWPVSASYDELRGCAAWMGGRIPTLEEARSLYTYVDDMRKARATSNATQKVIPAVNGHLVNNGVRETPPAHSNGERIGAITDSTDASPKPDATFVALEGANVGFQNWHPSPVTHLGDKLCGQGDFGGLWEWTSSPLTKPPGYEPMPLYPAYSSDFFDGKHNVVLGGSWATVPRIAGRKSFVNWYQRNYPFVWAGARVVRDL